MELSFKLKAQEAIIKRLRAVCGTIGLLLIAIAKGEEDKVFDALARENDTKNEPPTSA